MDVIHQIGFFGRVIQVPPGAKSMSIDEEIEAVRQDESLNGEAKGAKLLTLYQKRLHQNPPTKHYQKD